MIRRYEQSVFPRWQTRLEEAVEAVTKAHKLVPQRLQTLLQARGAAPGDTPGRHIPPRPKQADLGRPAAGDSRLWHIPEVRRTSAKAR